MSVDEAVSVLKQETEKGFWDASIVSAFLELLDEGADSTS